MSRQGYTWSVLVTPPVSSGTGLVEIAEARRGRVRVRVRRMSLEKRIGGDEIGGRSRF